MLAADSGRLAQRGTRASTRERPHYDRVELSSGNASTIVARTHVSVWWEAASVDDVAGLAAELRGLAVRAHEQFAVLLVVEPTAELSPQEARRAALAMLRELGLRIDAIAIVIEGDGFRAAGVRAMFSTMSLVVRMPFQWSLFRRADEAAAWLHARGMTGVSDSAMLDDAVERLRRPPLARAD